MLIPSPSAQRRDMAVAMTHDRRIVNARGNSPWHGHHTPSHRSTGVPGRDAEFQVEVIPNQGAGAAAMRIEAVRRIFNRCHFDENLTRRSVRRDSTH